MNGFIGWADILGYKSFLQNTTSQTAVESVLEVVDATGPETADEIGKLFVDKDDELLNLIHASAEWFSFSDTIVLFVSIPHLPAKFSHMESDMPFYCANYAAVAMDILQMRMFEHGLPIRGALHFGEYFRRGNSFGGKAIIPTHNLAETLNMAGVVVTGAAAARLKYDVTGNPAPSAELVVSYLTPFKSTTGEERELKYLLTSGDAIVLAGRDLEQEVRTAFTSHGKIIGDGVDAKLRNTVSFLTGVQTGDIKRVQPDELPELFHHEHE